MNDFNSGVIAAIAVAIFVPLIIYSALFVLGFIMAWPVMWAWNGSVVVLFPTVFKAITYWPAFWLYILCSLLIKSTQTNNNKKD